MITNQSSWVSFRRALLLPYLKAEHSFSKLPHVPRLAYALFLSGEPSQHTTHEVIYSFDKQAIVSDEIVDSHLHSAHDPAEVVAAQEALLHHPEFLDAIKRFKIPDGTQICTDPCKSSFALGKRESLKISRDLRL